MKKTTTILILLLVLMLPVIASAYYAHPAPDRLIGESFWHWFMRAMIDPF